MIKLIAGILTTSALFFCYGLYPKLNKTTGPQAASLFSESPLKPTRSVSAEYSQERGAAPRTQFSQPQSQNPKPIESMDSSELFHEIIRISDQLKLHFFNTRFKKIEGSTEEVEPGVFIRSRPLSDSALEVYKSFLDTSSCWRFRFSVPGQDREFQLFGALDFQYSYTNQRTEKKVASISFKLESENESGYFFSNGFDVFEGPEKGRIYFLTDISRTEMEMANEFPFIVVRAPIFKTEKIEISVFNTRLKIWQKYWSTNLVPKISNDSHSQVFHGEGDEEVTYFGAHYCPSRDFNE